MSVEKTIHLPFMATRRTRTGMMMAAKGFMVVCDCLRAAVGRDERKRLCL
jgi:hypothetical protein